MAVPAGAASIRFIAPVVRATAEKLALKKFPSHSETGQIAQCVYRCWWPFAIVEFMKLTKSVFLTRRIFFRAKLENWTFSQSIPGDISVIFCSRPPTHPVVDWAGLPQNPFDGQAVAGISQRSDAGAGEKLASQLSTRPTSTAR
ncbi:hypothetical protein RUM44_001704 [Polyplax serrata]|uniref:Uncharacterized protein n=1 Tax=Polyplax serrata TaxID=468196 RepID=A0ABR1AKT5_POLSC